MIGAIGGYFGLEDPAQDRHAEMPGALRFCSARAAFLALLRAGRPGKVWLPWFVCDAMPDTANQAGVQVARYRIEPDGSIDSTLDIARDDWLLCLNQFGMRSAQVHEALARFPAGQVIVDQAQAWFTPPADCLGTLYSPRKFAGLPDGGLLHTALPIRVSAGNDHASRLRMKHMQMRMDGQLEQGLAAFRESELSLAREAMPGMSEVTAALLDRIDFVAHEARRRANFQFLALHLQSLNALDWKAEANDAPLCYPLLLREGGKIREGLARRGIFCPVLWPEVAAREHPNSGWERRLARDVICLPVDHRYEPADMQRIVAALRGLIAERGQQGAA
jgi:hypothetical protein